jgi:dynein light intermediate chain
MTIQAYQTLYESSVAFGMRKALQAEQRKAEMIMKIRQLENTCDNLEQKVMEMSREIANKLNREKEERDGDDLDHLEDVKAIEGGNNEFKMDLAKLLSTLKVPQNQ